MASNIKCRLEDQPELALSRKPVKADVPVEMIRAQQSAAAAFTLACSASGLEDKEIYLSIGIDAGYFSNIKKGKATLQADLLRAFCERVGNSVYAEWMAYQLGCTLVVIKSESERRAEEAEKRAVEAEARANMLMEILQGKAA